MEASVEFLQTLSLHFVRPPLIARDDVRPQRRHKAMHQQNAREKSDARVRKRHGALPGR
jgi:hypothetical protein